MFSRMLFSKQHRLTYIVVSAIIGCACATIFDMRSHGIASATAAGIPLQFAAFWLIGVFLVDLTWRVRTHSSNRKWARAATWSGICLGVIAITWILAAMVIPDSASVYLMVRRPYIDAHWQVDPITNLTYFPLAFYHVDESGKTVVPGHFFVLDRGNQLVVNPISHVVDWPKCPGAIYTAYRLEDQIYIVRHYTIGATAPLFACLITPIPNRERPA